MSDTFKQFCRQMAIEQTKTLLHHKSNAQVEACIKFIKCRIKKCLDNNNYVNLALLQIRAYVQRYRIKQSCHAADLMDQQKAFYPK